MNILLLGGGGREFAFAQKISQSPLCHQLYIAPGNGSTDVFGENINLDINDFKVVKDFCLNHCIDLLLPGSEAPLVAGIYDYFYENPATQHIQVVGPSKNGAQLEGSKAFAKEFMKRHQIPTAPYREFDYENLAEGLDYIDEQAPPIVLKADGLAGGKGVVITEDKAEAMEAFKAMVAGQSFGGAGKKVVIEGFLNGIECSIFVLTDGDNYVVLPNSKDYKRIGEGETGLNTGGMGAISPVPFVKGDFMEKITRKIIEPTIKGLRTEKLTYRGFIYFGLINVNNEPFVIEYNCRMGDPETEVVLPRLENDLLELFQKMKTTSLNEIEIKYKNEAAATVMLVSEGYPKSYEKGKSITGLDQCQNVTLYHAGTKKEKDGTIKTSGGRVIAITATGDTIADALKTAYQNVKNVTFEGKYYRKDIGFEFV